ncbi:MAG TPA: medium chain dehydrogenase/reductase family protein [Solirubrobacteraceae bacterium]|jgi:NADPH:quinone reductase-like Zn-dependent oxidoreductase
MTPVPPTTPAEILTEIVLPGVVEPDGLIVQHRPVPVPQQGYALVELLATGVSFAEQGMRRNRYPGQPKFPFVLGYDLVGTVTAVGPRVDPTLVGQRVAAVPRTGAWTTHALLDARTLVPIPQGVDPADGETVVVNGITAWQMLHRKARVRAGQTVLIHGANGGVGNILVQLARHAGVRIIATASPRHHDTLRNMGAEPVDYNDPDLPDRVRALAPGGVDAVFDHLGGPSFKRSYDLLAPGGTLVAYGFAAQRDDTTNPILIFLGVYARFGLWALRPNRRHALFYNFWGGSRVTPKRFRQRLASDLTQVLKLLADGTLTAHVAARIPLDQASRGMALAESRTILGKVILTP